MLSLLLIILLLQITSHLVNTIGAKTINELLWQTSLNLSILPLSSRTLSIRQTTLRRDVVRLKRDMGAISAQDDFARWAKVRREHDKVLAEHDAVSARLTTLKSSFDSTATVVRWVGTSGLRFGIQFWFAKRAVFEVPRGWFPGWIEWLVGFPRCAVPGGVSVNVWSTVCGVVVALIGEAIGEVLVMSGTIKSQKEEPTTREKVAVPVGGVGNEAKKEL